MTYKKETTATISKLEQEITRLSDPAHQASKGLTTAKAVAKEVKRLKNMISAYESRLLKRAKAEDVQDQLEARN